MSEPNRGSEGRFLVALGQQIAYWRKLRGLTPAQLGELAGISESTIKRAEKKGPTRMADIDSIADALQVDLVTMIRRAKEDGASDAATAPTSDEEPDRRLA